MRLVNYLNNAKQRLVDDCTNCGSCIVNCKALENRTNILNAAEEIQQGIRAYLGGVNELPKLAQMKVDACMRCYGCMDIVCPIGLDPMTVNLVAVREKELRKEKPFDIPLYAEHHQRLSLVSDEERKRLTTEVITPNADIVFFAGCNVYRQPELLLDALDILDIIGVPYSFIPGVIHCCGLDGRGFIGDGEQFMERTLDLLNCVKRTGAKRVVFWCATCLCNMNHLVKTFEDPTYEFLTYGEFVLEYIDKLSFVNTISRTVTVHEPCKSAYMGFGVECVDRIMEKIPGTKVVKMEHHGRDTMCCGSAAVLTDPEAADAITAKRLKEAEETEADVLIDVCHACHRYFVQAQKNHPKLLADMEIMNYATYIARALGYGREDTLQNANNKTMVSN